MVVFLDEQGFKRFLLLFCYFCFIYSFNKFKINIFIFFSIVFIIILNNITFISLTSIRIIVFLYSIFQILMKQTRFSSHI